MSVTEWPRSGCAAPGLFQDARDGGVYNFVVGNSLSTAFSAIPQEPILGQPVVRLIPRSTLRAGDYFLHEYVGADGDQYAGFGLQP